MFGRQFGIDVDAKIYANRLYLQYGRKISAPSLQEISGFIRVLKSNNVWHLLSDFWFLKSGNNLGSGSVLPSFYGRNNGTLVNGPTWGENFITFGNDMYVSLNLRKTINLTSFSFVGICNIVSGTGNDTFFSLDAFTPINTINCIYAFSRNGGAGQMGLTESALTANPGTTRTWGDQTFSVSGFNTWSAGRQNLDIISDGYTSFNGTRYTNTSGTGIKPRTANGSTTSLFARSIGENRASFAAISNYFLTQSQIDVIRLAARNTICRGLSLP